MRWEVDRREEVKKRLMRDGVKYFTKIKEDTTDRGVGFKKRKDRMSRVEKSRGSGALGQKSKLKWRNKTVGDTKIRED